MRTNQSRRGFTLVELMVAMALTLFIMVILSQAFVISLETFSGLKGIGDMQENLRSASVILRDDLMQSHFDGARRLADVTAAQKPQAGFVVIVQGSIPVNAQGSSPYPPDPYVCEGLDGSGMPSYRASNHLLYMAVKRKGNQPQNFLTATLNTAASPGAVDTFFKTQSAYTMSPTADYPDSTYAIPYMPGQQTSFYASQWSEVIYYLEQTGSTEEPNNTSSSIGTPVYRLMRAQFVMVPDSTNVNNAKIPGTNLAAFQNLSCLNAGGTLAFFSPQDVAVGQRVVANPTSLFGAGGVLNPASASFARVTPVATLVLPSVTSFQVQILPTGPSTTFTDVPGNVFDSTSATYGLKAIQITLRVWDQKTRQTRQLTLIQDM